MVVEVLKKLDTDDGSDSILQSDLARQSTNHGGNRDLHGERVRLSIPEDAEILLESHTWSLLDRPGMIARKQVDWSVLEPPWLGRA